MRYFVGHTDESTLDACGMEAWIHSVLPSIVVSQQRVYRRVISWFAILRAPQSGVVS